MLKIFGNDDAEKGDPDTEMIARGEVFSDKIT